VQANCNLERHAGKKYCLEHYKQLDNYAYGLDVEIQKKLDAKLDPNKMAQAQAFVEALTGEAFPGSFQESLKSGVRLCKAINAIRPNLVQHINMINSPFKHRENIAAYLAACKALGMKEVDLFVTQDLYEGDNLVIVVDNLYALGALAMKQPGYRGPTIGVKHASENPREFSQDVLNAGKAAPTRQTVGSYGYQDESKNPIIARQIIRNTTGYQASDMPSKQNIGSVEVSQGKGLSGIDQIIKNPEELAANRGASAPKVGGGGAFCSRCGNKRLDAAAKFCAGCGTPL